jgi:hypothetical protein
VLGDNDFMFRLEGLADKDIDSEADSLADSGVETVAGTGELNTELTGVPSDSVAASDTGSAVTISGEASANAPAKSLLGVFRSPWLDWVAR